MGGLTLSKRVLFREWLLVLSGVALLISSLITEQWPVLSVEDIEVLYLLLALFVAVNGLKVHGAFSKIAKYTSNIRYLHMKLFLITFVLSMVVTNDVALLVMVPLTLDLRIKHKDLAVILEAIAANAGSALTPTGNPQNLFIYWYYHVSPLRFMAAIAPLSGLLLIVFVLISMGIKSQEQAENQEDTQDQPINPKAYLYGVFLFIIIAAVLRVIPAFVVWIVVILPVFFDTKVLKVDYALLLSFLFLFCLSNELKDLLPIKKGTDVFLTTALASQVISNVPATLVMAKGTQNWQPLLWGASAGGFGGLFGSFANLIAYKLFIRNRAPKETVKFTVKFLVFNIMALILVMGLYYLIR